MYRARAVTIRACLIASFAACHPSATVERTMPVASLQTYGTLALRVRSTAFAAQGQAMFLENAVVNKLRQQCSFTTVGRPGAEPADLVLDLNVTAVARGGTGLLRNPNQATIDTLLVLSDGRDGELLGTAKIRGKSSGVLINNGVPENEAAEVIAKSIAELLAKSGCSGPRIARAEPAPPPPPDGPDVAPPGDAGAGSAAPPPPNDEARAQAEALNERGKDALYEADVAGAVASFEQASNLVPDPRYAFNLCLALGAQEQWDRAVAACQRARGMNPNAALTAKIDHRIDLLQHRQ